MTHDVIVVIAAAGVAGQALIGLLVVGGLLELARIAYPISALRRLLWGYELWIGFLIAAIGTGGSLFFSEIAHFVPCELCWYERICMYPLSAVLLLAALGREHVIARYLLPLPIVGAGLAVYHMLVENGAVAQTQACVASAPGGCATKWIDEFGYVTIPTLTLTAFLMLLVPLLLASFDLGGAPVGGR